MPRRRKKKPRPPRKGELHRTHSPLTHRGRGTPVAALVVVAEGIHDSEFDKLRCALLRCLLSEDTVSLPEGVRVSLLTPDEARAAGVRIPNAKISELKKRQNKEPRKAWSEDDVLDSGET